jgi:hypothetical protein
MLSLSLRVSYRDLPWSRLDRIKRIFDTIFDLLSNFTTAIDYPNTQNLDNDS